MCIALFSYQKRRGLGFYGIYSKSQIITEHLVSSTNWNLKEMNHSICKTISLQRLCPMIHRVSGGPHYETVNHILPKWVILPRIYYGDSLFSLKQGQRTKLFSLEGEDVFRVANVLLCVFLKYFLSCSGRIHKEEEHGQKSRRTHGHIWLSI